MCGNIFFLESWEFISGLRFLNYFSWTLKCQIMLNNIPAFRISLWYWKTKTLKKVNPQSSSKHNKIRPFLCTSMFSNTFVYRHIKFSSLKSIKKNFKDSKGHFLTLSVIYVFQIFCWLSTVSIKKKKKDLIQIGFFYFCKTIIRNKQNKTKNNH